MIRVAILDGQYKTIADINNFLTNRRHPDGNAIDQDLHIMDTERQLIGRVEVTVALLAAVLSLSGYYGYEAWRGRLIDMEGHDSLGRAASVVRAGFINEHVFGDDSILVRLPDGSRYVCAMVPSTAEMTGCNRLRVAEQR